MRFLRGLGALIAIVAVVVGIPAALVIFNPIPAPWTWSLDGLMRPQSPEMILLGVLAAVAWLAWAGLVACLVVEVVHLVSGRRLQLPAIAGFPIGQKVAAALIVAVVAMIVTPHTSVTPAQAEPADRPDTAPSQTAPADTQGTQSRGADSGPAQARAPQSQAQDREIIHTVERGEHLWTLAEEYLGDGAEWQAIAELNDLEDPSRLAVGQKLRIIVPEAAEPPTEVTVARGDSLSSVSQDVYGSPGHWPEIYDANRDQLHDPDQIDVGQILAIPELSEPANHHGGDGAVEDEQDDVVTQNKQDEKPQQDEPTHPEPEADAGTDAEPRPQTGGEAPERPAETTPPTQQPNPRSNQPAEQQTNPQAEQQAEEQAGAVAGDDEIVLSPAAIAGVSVGLLLAAGLVTGLASRRHRQHVTRRPGRKIPTVAEDTAAFETAVRAQYEPFMVGHLDRIMRAIAAHALQDGTDVPVLSAARVAQDRVDFLLTDPATRPPPGIDLAADGSVWTVHAASAAILTDIEGLDETPPPWPALVTLGRDADTAEILIDLEAAAALTITGDTPEAAAAMLATVALELAVSPWAEDLSITLVGQACPELDPALAHPSVQHVDDIDLVLDGLEIRAAQQRTHLEAAAADPSTSTTLGQNRLEPELADAWAPRIVLLGDVLTPDQSARLGQIVTDLPRVAIAAVTTSPAPITDWHIDLTGEPPTGQLSPHAWALTPNLVTPDATRHIVELLANSTTEHTEPAPWWDHTANPTQTEATVTFLHTAAETPPEAHEPTNGPIDGPKDEADDEADEGEESAVEAGGQLGDEAGHPGAAAIQQTRPRSQRGPLRLNAIYAAVGSEELGDQAPQGWTETTDSGVLSISSPVHPRLQLLGAPDLLAAAGEASRNPGRCMEIALYLMDHPGSTTHGLAEHLCKSRSTAKSVVSYLRRWLGTDDEGTPYLPDAAPGGGGYRLDERVTTDWHEVRSLLGVGVNTAPTEALRAALDAVQGPPLRGAEDWLTYPSLHAEITGTLVDAAHVLVDRALASEGATTDVPNTEGPDTELAEWAARQGLLVQEDSEILLADLLRVHTLTGDSASAKRIGSRIARNARALGVDVAAETSELLRAATR